LTLSLRNNKNSQDYQNAGDSIIAACTQVGNSLVLSTFFLSLIRLVAGHHNIKIDKSAKNHDIEVPRQFYIRDSIFLMISLLYLIFLMYFGKINFLMSLILILIYFIYLCVVY
jgi:Ca2+/Na+ antiporter